MTTLKNFEDWPTDRPYSPSMEEWKSNLTRLKNPDGAVDPHNLNGTVTITTNGLNPAINIIQSGQGTASYLNFHDWPHAGFAYNYKLITDQIALADDSVSVGRGLVMGDVVDLHLTGAPVNKARIAHGAFLTVSAPVTSGAALSDFMGASWHYALSAFPVIGSTPSNPLGSLFAANPQVRLAPGAMNYVLAMGGEVDVEVDVGASAQFKFAWCVTTIGDDAVHGSVGEAALHIGAVPSTEGWKNGLAFSRFNGGVPIADDGTLITTNTPWGNNYTILHGIDLRGILITGFAFALGQSVNGPVYTVTGSGNVMGQSAQFANLNVSGNTQFNTVGVTGNLSVTGNTSDAGNFSASSGGFTTLTVTGASTLGATHVTGALALDLGLNVNGYVTTGQGMSVGGLINLPPIIAPSAPSSGFDIFVDQADGKLKVKASTGTVTVLALP